MFSELFDFVYPPLCLLCETRLGFDKPLYFCRSCFRNLPWIGKKACLECGRYLAASAHFKSRCKVCQQTKHFFTDACSALQFDETLKNLLFEMKYSGEWGLSKALSVLLLHPLKRMISDCKPNCITFVPLHPLRHKERGFNQSALLAKHLGKSLRIPVKSLIARNRWDAIQANTSWKERAKNIHGSFEILKKRDPMPEHVLLVDDVMTSGSTLNECSKVLKMAGSTRITLASLFSVAE
jgi:ComF family protein